MHRIASSLRTAGLPASPYPAPSLLNTLVQPVDSPISPSRRRLPPTPGGISSPSSPMTMPKPMPYYPLGAITSTSYSSLSSSFHTPASSGPPSLSHRTTASSTMSDNSSRHRMRYSNGPRSTSDGEKTPISSNEYLSQSSGSYSSNITKVEDIYRPPGALPPSAPSAHSSTSYSSQSQLFNPYANERLQDANGYQHHEPHHNQSHRVASYSSQLFKPPPPPPLPPLPPPVAIQHTTPSNDHLHSSAKNYADARQASPPIDTSLCTSCSI